MLSENPSHMGEHMHMARSARERSLHERLLDEDKARVVMTDLCPEVSRDRREGGSQQPAADGPEMVGC